jgi:hypothetical protein
VQSNTARGSFWGGWNWSQFEIEESLFYLPLGDMHEVVEEEIRTVAHVLQNLVASNQVCVAIEERELPFFPVLGDERGIKLPYLARTINACRYGSRHLEARESKHPCPRNPETSPPDHQNEFDFLWWPFR